VRLQRLLPLLGTAVAAFWLLELPFSMAFFMEESRQSPLSSYLQWIAIASVLLSSVFVAEIAVHVRFQRGYLYVNRKAPSETGLRTKLAHGLLLDCIMALPCELFFFWPGAAQRHPISACSARSSCGDSPATPARCRRTGTCGRRVAGSAAQRPAHRDAVRAGRLMEHDVIGKS
jgi:hypothetical protein